MASACSSVGPKYQKPAVPDFPGSFKETGNWSKASPRDDIPKGKYWEIFKDPELNLLEEQVDASNQNIAASFAAFAQARALVREAKAGYFPTATVSPQVFTSHGAITTSTGSQPIVNNGYTQYSLPLDATWVPDLWGKVADSVRQNVANAQMSAADLENTRLLQHTDLAIYYYQLRGQDSLQILYDSTVKAYTEALKLTRVRHETGIDSDESVAQAETQLDQAKAQATQLGIARAQYEHAIALLIGKSASGFSIRPKPLDISPPLVPVGVPSLILQRRPDIAAAERSVAAANAGIGVAMAAWFPDLTLTGTVGIISSSLSQLLSAPSIVWSLGGTLAETVFDGGLRSASVDASKAAYLQAVATYRQAVLTAFQQTEDSLAGLRLLEKEVGEQGSAVKSANRYLNIATNRYKLGIDPYLNVITAQTALLTSQQTEVTLKMQQLTTSMQLIEALGGGWDASNLPSDKEAAK